MSVTLNVAVYNIFSPVPKPLRIYGQHERAIRVKDVITGLNSNLPLDVVVIDELISPESQQNVFTDMLNLGFPYRTNKITTLLSVNGGVIVFSRHPITEESCTVFGNHCVGSDCLSSKGVVYARIHKENMHFHVFGTHLQAWSTVASQVVRQKQIKQTRRFIDSLKISRNEPVIFAGDLNIDLYTERDHIENAMYVLNMSLPQISEDSHPFTVDPQENKLVGSDSPSSYTSDEWPHGCVDEYYKTLVCPCCPAQWIDYVMYSQTHLHPIESNVRAVKAKVAPFGMNISVSQNVTIEDVSDHFPIVGHFMFPLISMSKENTDTVPTTDISTLLVPIILVTIGLAMAMFTWKKNSGAFKSNQVLNKPSNKRTTNG